jgi:hypothetical protein
MKIPWIRGNLSAGGSCARSSPEMGGLSETDVSRVLESDRGFRVKRDSQQNPPRLIGEIWGIKEVHKAN